jgi:hypothetical protein
LSKRLIARTARTPDHPAPCRLTGRPGGRRNRGPARLAEDAAQAIQALNHATLPGAEGLAEPTDVYAVLGSLTTLVSRLPKPCLSWRSS